MLNIINNLALFYSNRFKNKFWKIMFYFKAKNTIYNINIITPLNFSTVFYVHYNKYYINVEKYI